MASTLSTTCRQRQQQSESMFRDRRFAINRHVADADAALAAIVQVDLVKARGARGAQFQMGNWSRSPTANDEFSAVLMISAS